MEDIDNPRWRKASYSGANGGGCVEVGHRAGTILVRDTKNRDGGQLRFSLTTWRKFAQRVKRIG
jgi:Domain of unknown function (DUF397)